MMHPTLMLCLNIVFLIIVSLLTFILFRHIEIRKVEAHNEAATEETPKKIHTKQDDKYICIHVLLILVFLLVFMNKIKDSLWISLASSFVLILLISVAYLARSGSPMPDLIRERMLEYFALFSLLVFLAGAAVAGVGYSTLKLINGSNYAGPARIVGYEAIENVYDDDDEVVEEEEEEQEEKNDDNKDDDQNQNYDDDQNQNNDDNNNDDQNQNYNDDQNQNYDDDQNNNDDGGRRNLGGSNSGDRDNQSNDRSNSRESGSGDNRQKEASNYAYIEVAFGGSWACPEKSYGGQCVTNIETDCSRWDADESSRYRAETWKYGFNGNDGRLTNVFSCAWGYEDGKGQNENYYNYVNYSPDESNDGTPYGYIIGNCNTCEATWAWRSAYRRYDAMDNFKALQTDYLIMSGAAVLLWVLATAMRTAPTSTKRQRNSRKQKKANLLSNEGGDDSDFA